MKKLTLNKETIKALDNDRLENVNGGTIVNVESYIETHNGCAWLGGDMSQCPGVVCIVGDSAAGPAYCAL